MLPHFPDPVEVERIDEGDLAVLWLEYERESLVGNLLYEEICDVSWAEVAAVIQEERALLELASQTTTNDGFDVRADALVRERYSGERFEPDGSEIDEGPLTRFQEIDLGAMSAVAALVAIGALTATSCRGHHSMRGERRPLVLFFCDGQVLASVTRAARRSGCGLLLDDFGRLQLYAADVSAFVRFAEALLGVSDELPAAHEYGPMVRRYPIDEYVDLLEANHGFSYFARRHLDLVAQMIASNEPIRGQDPLFD